MIRKPIEFPDTRPLVEVLHASTAMVSLHVTGAFVGLAHRIWEVPGASRTLLGSNITYARAATIEALVEDPGKFCTVATAIKMAERAYATAVRQIGVDRDLITFVPQPFGLGATASVVTDRTKRSADRFHIAVCGSEKLYVFSADFRPGLTREEQDGVCDAIALAVFALAAGIEPYPLTGYDAFLVTEHLRPVGSGQVTVDPDVHDIEELRFEELLARPLFMPDGTRGGLELLDRDTCAAALLCGAFNPLHYGHIGMAEAVQAGGEYRPVFALAVDHPDKGRLRYHEVMERLAQFRWKYPVLVTQGDGLFVEKARRFPARPFIVGADTVVRLLDPKYYGGGESGRDAVLDEFAALGTTFLVIDRQMPGGFVRLADLPIPEDHRSLFIHVDGRWNVSSSAIRDAQAKS